MPLFTAPIAAYERIERARTTDVDLLTANSEVPLLSPNLVRKGHLVKNAGTTLVTVLYGLNFIPDPPEGETLAPDAQPENFELYRFTLSPGDIYLYDTPEIIPFEAISLGDDGLIQVVELL